MNIYGQHTTTINDPGFRPATSWLNGQQVAGPDWNQMAAQQWSARQQALRETPEEEEDLLLSQLRRQYNPPVTQPGYASFTENGQQRFMIGGQDVTADLTREQLARSSQNPIASLKGDTGGYANPPALESLAQERLAAARRAAAQRSVDRLMGNEPASLNAISGLLSDPRVQGQDLASVGNLVKNVYGRGLDQYVNAQHLSQAYGQPMTWADIETLKARQANQSKELALMQAYSSMMGARGEMGGIVGADYDDELQGVKIATDDGDARTFKMPREQHDEIKRRFSNVFFNRPGQQSTTGTPAPKQLLAKSGGVKLRAPDGSIAVVRPEAVPRYTALGAVVIE